VISSPANVLCPAGTRFRPSWSRPRAAKQYVQFLGNGIVRVDAKTGRFLWRYEPTSKGPTNIPTPVARDGYDTGAVIWPLSLRDTAECASLRTNSRNGDIQRPGCNPPLIMV
jgi:hypothetical protein